MFNRHGKTNRQHFSPKKFEKQRNSEQAWKNNKHFTTHGTNYKQKDHHQKWNDHHFPYAKTQKKSNEKNLTKSFCITIYFHFVCCCCFINKWIHVRVWLKNPTKTSENYKKRVWNELFISFRSQKQNNTNSMQFLTLSNRTWMELSCVFIRSVTIFRCRYFVFPQN